MNATTTTTKITATGNRNLLDRLQGVECRDSTYPVKDAPIVFSTAFGSMIEDVEGRKYLDLCAGFGALPLGHNPPCVRSAMARWTQNPLSIPIEHGMGDVYPSAAKVKLLEALIALMPTHLKRASLSLTGSQAVEIALKTAMLATKKTGFLAFRDGYHGVDLGVLPVTSREDFSAPFKTWIGGATVIQASFGAPREEIKRAITQLQKSPSGFAGIIVEPAQGRAGVVFPPEHWLGALLTAAHAANGLLIFDEVFTGLGRLGQWTAAESVAADLVCFGKALGGGFPLSACVGTEAAMNAWPQSTGEAIHTGTFFGHPFTCEMALASLQEMRTTKIVEHTVARGDYFLSGLRKALKGKLSVIDVRGLGLMIGIEFKGDGEGVTVMDSLRASGVIALVSGSRGHVLSLTPPLNISDDEIKLAIQKIAGVIC